MKKRLFCLLLSAVLVMGLLAGCSKKITVDTDLEDMELEGPEEWKTGEEYKAELIPDDGYLLPEKITVKVDGSKLSSKEYEYDPEDGDLTIPGEFVTGDIKISGDAEEITLVGKWSAELDISPVLNYWMEEEQNVDMDGIYFSGITIRVDLEFDKTGTYTVTVDTRTVDELEDKIAEEYLNLLYDAAEAGLDDSPYATVDEMIAAARENAGADTDEELVGYLMEGFELYECIDIFYELDEYGDYVDVDGEIAFEYAWDDVRYYIDGRTLTLKHTGDDEFAELMFPMVFKRAS